MQTQQHQQHKQGRPPETEAPKTPPPEYADGYEGVTMLFHSKEEPDAKLASEWYAQHKGEVGDALLLTELRLDQMHNKSRVIVLARDNARDTSFKRYVNGETIVTVDHAPIEPRAAIYGREFWRETVKGQPQFGGQIDHLAVVRKLGEGASPLVPHYRPEQSPGVVSLRYA